MFDTQKDVYKKIIGRVGEKAVVKYMKRRKMRILATNYRTPFGEVDVLALDGETIVFVEVKTRSSDAYGVPSDAVDKTKQLHIIRSAIYFLKAKRRMESPIRFDVAEVDAKTKEVNYLENAFDSSGIY